MLFDAYDDHKNGEMEGKMVFRLVYDLYGDKELVWYCACILLGSSGDVYVGFPNRFVFKRGGQRQRRDVDQV
jgi:hypothetical protein